jgi:hypothetical protein
LVNFNVLIEAVPRTTKLDSVVVPLTTNPVRVAVPFLTLILVMVAVPKVAVPAKLMVPVGVLSKS